MTADERLRRLEDKAAIEDLVVLYGFVMDERDEDGVRRLFCPDATLRSGDGVVGTAGVDAIVETYLGRWSVLGPTNHVSHGHVVRLDAGDPDRATGLVAAHAEVVRHGVTMLVALRYEDEYCREGGAWRFHAREMSYMYYVPATEYAEGVRDPLAMRAYEQPTRANWPWALHDGGPGRLAAYLG